MPFKQLQTSELKSYLATDSMIVVNIMNYNHSSLSSIEYSKSEYNTSTLTKAAENKSEASVILPAEDNIIYHKTYK